MKTMEFKGQDGLAVKTVLSLHGFSRHEISRLKFTKAGIMVNGIERRVDYVMAKRDVLRITFVDPSRAYGESHIVPKVLYEDEDVIVVHKDAGVVAHQSHGHMDDDMVTALNMRDPSFVYRPIGRLDKDVSGIMMYAKNTPAAARLNQQRIDGVLEKTYLAIVSPVMDKPQGTLRFFLAKQQGVKARSVGEEGKSCVTHYFVRESNGVSSLLEVWIETGRTHQIRAGFAYEGHPLEGDALYGGNVARIFRPALHCASIRFLLPFVQKEIRLECPMPDDMTFLLHSGC